MKKLVKVEEVAGEGLMALMGEEVLVFCMNYNYAGVLVGVNESYIKLENAHLVFETGAFSASTYADSQKLFGDHYIQLNSVESFCKGKKH